MGKIQEPYLVKYSETEWEFVHPEIIYDEEISSKYWEAVECLDYEDFFAETVFKTLIQNFSFYIDAYNHLSISFRNQKKTFESYVTAEKIYNMCKALFPKEFNYKTDKIIWSILENRPFLRSCQIWGLECQESKEFRKAIEIYSEILSYNENDNQGVRYLILECLFALKDYKGAEKLLKKYDDDWSIEFSYGKLAIEILKGNQNVKELMENAIKINPYLPDEIIKTKHKAPPPHRIPGEPNFDAGIPIGSIQQAYEHWKRNKSIFKQKKIIDFFKKTKNISA